MIDKFAKPEAEAARCIDCAARILLAAGAAAVATLLAFAVVLSRAAHWP